MSDIKLLTQSDLMKAIPLLSADAKSVQERIHQCACSALDHVRAHGDTTGFVALLNALPNGQRVKALAYWAKHFSSSKLIMTFDKKAKSWTAKLSKDRKDEDFGINSAMATSFADLTEEQEPKSMTVEALIKKLTTASTNSENFDGTTIPKVEPAARALAAKLVAFIRAEQTPATKAA
jgi:hypothetical protein